MRKFIAILAGLGAIAGSLPVFLRFWDQSQVTGNPDDFFSGLFFGAICVFVGLIILTNVQPIPEDAAEDEPDLLTVGGPPSGDTSDVREY